MSFLSKLTIDNIEYNVLSAEYRIKQSDDGTGLPNEETMAGKLLVKIESTKDVTLIEWAMSTRTRKDGALILYNRDSVSTFRKIEFKDAYCLDFFEKFDGENNEPLYSEILISAKELNIKGAKIVNDWPDIR
ncbi:type VI secretion system tube protein TssD [uncultured Algibacter sp.]|uniref:type VI secretion system tube protein TssD n=1 Tax=uncultured Algibacter sp. TaxID=298659 RepID=UPI003216D504